ncbi:MAG: hypothetical protein RIR48_2886 [Bacteroidota bacterium]|jgi:hypothetical protein
MYKKFDRELYEANDKLAKNAAKNVLSEFGYKNVRESTKRTDVDLIVADNTGEILFYVEVERKLVWTEKNFKYENVQFPERKAKYAKLDKPTYFLMFSNDMENYLVVKGKDLLQSPREIVRNKYIKYGEYFFQVPLNKVTFNNFKE